MMLGSIESRAADPPLGVVATSALASGDSWVYEGDFCSGPYGMGYPRE
jgi:hypothetical protein